MNASYNKKDSVKNRITVNYLFKKSSACRGLFIWKVVAQTIRKKVLFVIVIFCLFSFCQRKTGVEISNEAYSINIQDNTINNIKRLSDLIDTVEYTPLQTNDESVVGKIDRIKFYNNKIFICDRITNTIFIFKEDGAYLSKYKRIGKGPFEYLKLDDFDMDSDGNCYLLTNKKIIVLDSELNPVEEINIPVGTMRFAVFENIFAVAPLSIQEDEVLILSQKGEKLFGCFPYSGIPRIIGLKPFIKTDQKLLFIPNERDSIFSITADSISLYATINFEHPYPENFFKNQTPQSGGIFSGIVPDNYMHGVQGYCETDEFICFRFSYLYKNYDGPFYTLYSKSNDEAVIYTNEIINDCFSSIYPPLILDVTISGEFIATIDASMFITALKSNQYRMNIESKFDSLSNMSNPIIALIKFKI